MTGFEAALSQALFGLVQLEMPPLGEERSAYLREKLPAMDQLGLDLDSPEWERSSIRVDGTEREAHVHRSGALVGRGGRSRRPRRPRPVGARDRAQPARARDHRGARGLPGARRRRDVTEARESSDKESRPLRSAGLLPYRLRDGVRPRAAPGASRRALLGQEGRRCLVGCKRRARRRTKSPSRRRVGSSPKSSVRQPPPGPRLDLGEIRQPSGKRVRVWAVEGDLDVEAVVSNEFELEWPPHSGRTTSFPEVDRAAWMPAATAKRKLVKGQVEFVDRLVARLQESSGETPLPGVVTGHRPPGRPGPARYSISQRQAGRMSSPSASRCSRAKAIRMSVGSLQAVPTRQSPTGSSADLAHRQGDGRVAGDRSRLVARAGMRVTVDVVDAPRRPHRRKREHIGLGRLECGVDPFLARLSPVAGAGLQVARECRGHRPRQAAIRYSWP